MPNWTRQLQQQQHSQASTQQQHPTTAADEFIATSGDVLIDLESLEGSSTPPAAAEAVEQDRCISPTRAASDESTETPFAAPAAQAAASSTLTAAVHTTGAADRRPNSPPHAAATATAAVEGHAAGLHNPLSNLLQTRKFHSQHFWLSDEGLDHGPELSPSVAAATAARHAGNRDSSSGSFEDIMNESYTEESDSMSGSPTKQSLLQDWRRRHRSQHQQQQRGGRAQGKDPHSLPMSSSVPAAAPSAAGGSITAALDEQWSNSVGGIRRRSSLSYSHLQPRSGLSYSGLAEQPSLAAAGDHSSSKGPAATAAAAKSKWQKAAERVVQLNKATDTFKPWGLQGLDVKRHNYSDVLGPLHAEVEITVADYSTEQVQVVGNISNDSLSLFLDQPRPDWSRVRWINVQGLSWDVIKTLAVAYDLHPLSVEDIVHVPQRIKADYYQDYLYASVLLLSVEHPSQLTSSAPVHAEVTAQAAAHTAWSSLDICAHQHLSTAAAADVPVVAAGAGSSLDGSSSSTGCGGGGCVRQRQQPAKTSSPRAARYTSPQGKLQHAAPNKLHRLRTRLLRPSRSRAAVAASSQAPLHSMELMVEQASLFLFRDGTVLSIFSDEGEGVAQSILERLKGFKTLLTDSEDASFLFNTILDAVVDRALPVVQIYASRIAALETQVLVEPRPKAAITKELHLLGNDLKVLRRTLVPTQHLIHKLQGAHQDKNNTQGFLSPLTVVYLSDVLDHISTIVEDMETLAVDARDLIDLVFNTIAHQNNNSMQMLAVVSTIFLPITFIAGVYGTNFDQWFPEIHWQYGYCYFWGICAFVTVLFTGLLKYWGMFEG